MPAFKKHPVQSSSLGDKKIAGKESSALGAFSPLQKSANDFLSSITRADCHFISNWPTLRVETIPRWEATCSVFIKLGPATFTRWLKVVVLDLHSKWFSPGKVLSSTEMSKRAPCIIGSFNNQKREFDFGVLWCLKRLQTLKRLR